MRMPPTRPDWLTAIRRYFAFSALGHALWEAAQMPFYTIWRDGTWPEILFAGLHCAGGDLLIATAALIGALVIAGNSGWPGRGGRRRRRSHSCNRFHLYGVQRVAEHRGSRQLGLRGHHARAAGDRHGVDAVAAMDRRAYLCLAVGAKGSVSARISCASVFGGGKRQGANGRRWHGRPAGTLGRCIRNSG